MGYSRIIQYIYKKYEYCKGNLSVNEKLNIIGNEYDMNIAKGRGIDFNFADGMICDWKNEREYRLLGYISHMSENIADGYLQ